MIPIWVLIVFFVIFTVVLIWERWDYKNLYGYAETLEHFLDLYISQYGTIPGITKLPDEDIDGNRVE